MKTIWDTKLKVTEEAKGEKGLPRVIKLARRYKFSDKETLVLVYVFTCQAADQQSSITWRSSPFGGGGGLSFGQDTISMCKACDIKISEMLEFLNADREHMQQGIFPDVQQSFLLRSAITLDECSCRALLGVALKGNERLKIDQTRLAEILAEEEGAPSGEGVLQDTEPTTSGEASSHEGGDGGKVGVDNQEEVSSILVSLLGFHKATAILRSRERWRWRDKGWKVLCSLRSHKLRRSPISTCC